MRIANLVLLLGLLATVLAAPSRAEVDQETYEKAASDALRNMKQPGLREAKLGTIGVLRKDDRARSVEVLVRWAIRSGKMERRELAPAFEKAQEDFDKLERILLKGYEKMPPNRQNDKDAWDAKRRARDRAKDDVDTENEVQYELGQAIATTRDADAIRWILKSGLAQLRREDEAEEAAVGAVKALLEADASIVGEALLEEAESGKVPKARILALEWVAKTRNEAGFAAAVDALGAKADPVRRAGVRCLVALDDPRCVQPLIDVMADTSGILRSEIEDALHRYTGESFDETPDLWIRWWSEHGAAWFEGVTTKRFGRPTQRQGGSTFYGLETPSKRIVFVLDRSGSMKAAADAAEKEASDGEVQGETKVEVAKNQLARSIRQLSRDVHFNVIFYSTDVQVWQDPPAMLPATDENKKKAIDWFSSLEADGYTRTFDALLRALAYADNLDAKDPAKGGCDTIFLLSDGSPTVPGAGDVIQGEALEAEWGRVKEANRIFRCVIHTIGVGAQHNRPLMQRSASETGGTYKAVGGR